MIKIRQWLRGQAPRLDSLIAKAAREAFVQHPEWSAYELDDSLADLYRLHNGRDACYDRPSIGPTYALWYHGRRMHDALTLLAQPVLARGGGKLVVLDLGSGTGAVAWALGLLVA